MARKYNRITPGKRVHQVRGRSRHKAPMNHTGKKPNARKNNAVGLKPMRQIAHKRNRVIMTDPVKVAKPSSRVSPPAQHTIAYTPEDQEKEYKLFGSKGYIGMCTVVRVRKSRIAKGGMTRYRVAIDGREVGVAAKVGDRMKLLHK